MSKLLVLLALIGSLAILVMPNLAGASGTYICTGTVGSPFTTATTTVDSNLYVPAGASCSLYGVTVTGNVIVEGELAAVGNTFDKNLVVQGGSVVIGCFGSLYCSIHGGNFILGNAVMTNAKSISLTRTTYSGNLTVVGAGSFDLELSRADGNVLIANSAGVLVFSGIYGGDVRVMNNTDVLIGDINVSGALDCQGIRRRPISSVSSTWVPSAGSARQVNDATGADGPDVFLSRLWQTGQRPRAMNASWILAPVVVGS